jgi:formylglycine-generating enzyme required for sulfatase activity
MKLTPLGKALVFLIGLGLVLTAVYRFVPADQQPWRKWFGGGSEASTAPADTETVQDAPASPADASPSAPASPTASPTQDQGAAPSTSEWVSIPGGLFRAGSDQSEVEVPAFRILRTEVTNGQYEAFVNECGPGSGCGPRELPSYWEDRSYLETRRDHPVVFVSWGDASAYCRWKGGRLPTALEWEKAARGDDGRSFPTGGALDPAGVNILGSDRRDEKTRAPKQIPTWGVDEERYARDRSPSGVLAMAGNVSEWTASASEDEPDLRLAAGGSWDSWDLNDGRVYHRLPKNPTDRSSSLGFRCASSSR